MSNTVKKLDHAESVHIKKAAVRSRIDEITKVSSIPSMMKKIMEVAEDPGSAVTDLEKLIAHDQAIASRVVAVSNAAFYGFPRKINSISQAIMVLGFEMVKGLAVSTTIFNIKLSRHAKELGALWAHSFECAMASTLLARYSGLATKDSAFLAGLLHDIGKPLMIQACGDNYLETLSTDGLSPEKEEELLGASHTEAGMWFAEKCKLPIDCVMAILHHHAPSEYIKETTRNPALVQITYLANITAKGGKENASSQEFKETLRAVSISDEDYGALLAEFEKLKGTTPTFT